jgi:hypothetical protein
VGDLRAFDLQDYVDQYNCRYYVESGTTEDSIDYALRFPFERVYSIDIKVELVEFINKSYWFNKRVQAFNRVLSTAFYELVRMVPHEYNAVIWLYDDYVTQNIEQLAECRPAKTDIIIINNVYCSQLQCFAHIHKYFGLTHFISNAALGDNGKGLVLTPIKIYQSLQHSV